MKHLISLCGILLLLACSTNNNVAVTQTGNPTQVSLSIKADTTQTPATFALRKRMGTNFVITRAYMVVYKVEMEPIDGTEFVLFRGNNPYIIELLPNGEKGIIDSVNISGDNSYQSIEIEFGPLNDTLSTPAVPDSLKGRSVFVEGFFGTDSLIPFTYSSKKAESLELEFDSTLVVPLSNSAEILVKVRVFDWFRDSLGQFIDPRESANSDIIEKNISGSVDVEEDTDSEDSE